MSTPILNVIPEFSDMRRSSQRLNEKKEQMELKMEPRMKMAKKLSKPEIKNVLNSPWEQKYRKMRKSVSYLEALFPASVQQMEKIRKLQK